MACLARHKDLKGKHVISVENEFTCPGSAEYPACQPFFKVGGLHSTQPQDPAVKPIGKLLGPANNSNVVQFHDGFSFLKPGPRQETGS